ncbi:MAG: hypothetical protein ACRDP8_04320, partial [Actinopolymorphaceae bacterium]
DVTSDSGAKLEEFLAQSFGGNDDHLGVNAKCVTDEIDGGALVPDELAVALAHENAKSGDGQERLTNGFGHDRSFAEPQKRLSAQTVARVEFSHPGPGQQDVERLRQAQQQEDVVRAQVEWAIAAATVLFII